MPQRSDQDLQWRTSSYTDADRGICTEDPIGPESALIRDTKDRGLGRLAFDSAEWPLFVRAARDGCF
ncbi:hypothetical protein ABH917_000901 [Thermobifida halotolerans]